MKASLAAARQTQAAESVADNVTALKEQLDRIEALLSLFLESRDATIDDNQKEVGTTPKRGPKARS